MLRIKEIGAAEHVEGTICDLGRRQFADLDALDRRGAPELAAELRDRTLALVDEHGFAEYFSPTDGTGHGAPEFSWTAALTIDLVAAAQ